MSKSESVNDRIANTARLIDADETALKDMIVRADQLATTLREVADILDSTKHTHEVSSIIDDGRIIGLKDRDAFQYPAEDARKLISDIYQTKERLCQNDRKFKDLIRNYAARP